VTSFLSRLFGGKPQEAEPELHNGFRIFVEPIQEGGSYRVAARIEQDQDGAIRAHQMIRADTFNNLEEARASSLNKAKVLIDEQGAGLFDA